MELSGSLYANRIKVRCQTLNDNLSTYDLWVLITMKFNTFRNQKMIIDIIDNISGRLAYNILSLNRKTFG